MTLTADAERLAADLAAARSEGDELRRLPDSTWKQLLEGGFLRALQPARWGGGEVHLVEFLDAIITLSAANPSAGWVAGVIGVHPWQLALFDERRRSTDSLAAGEHGFAALANTPFYLEAGGQVSDVGTLRAPQGEAQVTGVLRVGGWPRLHAVHVRTGVVKARDLIAAEVAADVRDATRRHHTATHLLHAALRQEVAERLQGLVRELPQMVHRQTAALAHQQEIFNDFYGRYPTLSHPLFRPTLQQIAQRIMETEFPGQPWSPAVRDRIGTVATEFLRRMGGAAPSAPTAAAPAAPARPPV